MTDANASYHVAKEELRGFMDRLERLEEQKQTIREDQKAVLEEAKSSGYDGKTLRKLLSIRKRDKAIVETEEALLEMYRDALES